MRVYERSQFDIVEDVLDQEIVKIVFIYYRVDVDNQNGFANILIEGLQNLHEFAFQYFKLETFQFDMVKEFSTFSFRRSPETCKTS